MSTDNAPLSIDQAVAAMVGPGDSQISDDAAPAEAADPVETDPAEPDDEAAGDQSEGDPAPDEADDPDADPAIEGEQDDEPESDPDQPVIAAPKSWDAAERAEFAKLPRAAQEIVAARETERDKAVSRAQSEAGEARKQVETQLAGVGEFKAKLDQAVTKAQTVFAGKWDGIDWLTFAREDQAAYTIAKAGFDADQAELASIEATQAEAAEVQRKAEDREFQSYLQAEREKLTTEAPDLVDPAEGPARIAKVAKYLLSKGVTSTQLENISAFELSLAYDGIRFREGQDALKTATTAKTATAPKPVPKAAPTKTATPSAAAPARPTQQRSVEQARARLDKSGAVDDAVALLLAKDQKP
jgi:hypothetical protein